MGFLFTFFMREDPNTTIQWALTGPPANHHLNGVSLACR